MKDNNMDYIKTYRSIENWGWYKDIYTFKLFSHCLIKANWKDGEFMGNKIPRGSFATSLENLSHQTGLTMQQIRTSLKKLESTGEISRKSTNKFTIINVANYGIYQDGNVPTNKQLTNKQQTTNKPLTTIEERKKERNNIIINNNIKSFYENTKLNEVFLEYLDTRKKLKVPNSERAVSLLQNKLNEYSDDTKIKMLEEAIVNGWKSVYPLKQQKENVSFLDL